MYQNHHRHSYYSNTLVPDVVVSNEDFAKRAVELGHGIISGVEHGHQGRYIEGFELAKKYNLKFLFGTEAYMVLNRFEKDNTNAHIILLAKNENGRKSINKILSEANLTGFYYRPRIDLSLLLSLPKNDVWVTSSCVGGLWKYDNYEELFSQISNHFENNFFFEVQAHNTDSQRNLNKKVLNLSSLMGNQIIFGCDSHYIYPHQNKNRDDYLLSKHVVYEDESGWYMDYPDDQTVIQRFVDQGVLTNSQIKQAMDNTNVFLEVEEYNGNIFKPGAKIPTLYPEKTQEEKNIIFKQLIQAQWDTEKANIDPLKHEFYEKEIEKEVNIVVETGMSDYFLLDYSIVKRGKELGGHITMTGRGSAPSFYLSKLLGFTTIDRISAEVKLFPERFITKERILEAGTLPDIDFNLGNPEIFAQAQKEILGSDHSYPMVAYGTLQPKAAWKLYARAKNISFELANKVSEQIDKYEKDLKHAPEEEKDQISPLDYIDEEYHSVFTESKDYLGIVSDAKVHPCAHLLYNGNISEEIGLIKVKENLCCCMDGLWAEKYSFLKNDLLKVSVVDLIYKVYDRIGINPHPLPQLIKICENDNTIWDVYKNAWTIGINQVEQTSTSGRVAKYGPKNISELSAFVAAVRPGFQSNYKQFESREKFEYGVKSLDKLIQTEQFPQSYLIYQENSMQVLAYAGIPISQTYEIVKNIAKKRVEKVLKYKDQFIEGMKIKLITEEKLNDKESSEIAKKTWQIIEDSSHYSFNSSHAYSVAGDSLYGAYLKSHYPLEFYETFLTLLEQDGDKDRLVRAKEEATRAYGISFPPQKFGQDNRKILANKENNSITSSLSTIKGFGNIISQQMYDVGKNKFDNFIDFLIYCEENDCFTSKISELIKINYFDIFGKNKKLLNIFNEFTSGKSRYSKTHTIKTKEKRKEELYNIWNSLDNESIDFFEQINYDMEIVGRIQATYPVDKRYVYVISVDEKFAPRVQIHSLATGKQMSVKVQKKTYENNVFYGGEILYVHTFREKPSTKFIDGKYVEAEDEKTWWLEKYSLVKKEDFDKLM